MKILTLLFFLVSLISQAQTFELRNKKLIRYYDLINEAEKKIITNDLNGANVLYKKAFREFKYPHAKDLQNSMKVALKTNDLETAYAHYQTLKCLGKKFDDDFLTKNFKNYEEYKKIPCQNTIDLTYKKSLDSLVKVDQYYRKLSGGNYQAYKKEITKSDSIASTNLLKLIQKKGFPNEYNIGLEMKSWVYFHDFYLIIWHQLASNNISSQKVNFSNEIVKALNDGKIRPDIAGFLLDLNNNTYDYSYFKIYQFNSNDERSDCCYVSKDFLPENRNESSLKKIQQVNGKRKLLGLSSTEEEVRKSIFYLNNKDYIFSNNVIEGWNFNNSKDADIMKKSLIKLDDTPH
ncbi:hypothetical protein MUU74_10925 [Chryseobacterium daecheongense]|uniref:hypothetical protein n=1 Tax=Chryseobacterium daecheongense TaxID=192389 RepID=UPI001FD636A1|nr:hypothetical protein [Chryseobacterium daecheongense]UOU97007.1 hypothetical protein MUU74_10925 [Chryseobacterium daecheongense]